MHSKLSVIEALQAHSENLRLASVFRVLARGHDLHAAFGAIVAEKSAAAFGPSLQLLEDKRKLAHSVDQLYLAVVRAAVTESFELTRDYCRKTKQTKSLKAQKWFTVIRMIRNALNHNFHFRFSSDDLLELPASWGPIIIDAELEGKELTQTILPPETAIAWLAELDEYVSRGLN